MSVDRRKRVELGLAESITTRRGDERGWRGSKPDAEEQLSSYSCKKRAAGELTKSNALVLGLEQLHTEISTLTLLAMDEENGFHSTTRTDNSLTNSIPWKLYDYVAILARTFNEATLCCFALFD